MAMGFGFGFGYGLGVGARLSAAAIVTLFETQFDDSVGWSLSGGWSISGGSLTHTTGAISQANRAFTPGAGLLTVRFFVSGRTGGTVQPLLLGGSTVSGSTVNTNGESIQQLEAVAGNTTFRFTAASSFNGSIESLIITRP
jgi:hypothetical protein